MGSDKVGVRHKHARKSSQVESVYQMKCLEELGLRDACIEQASLDYGLAGIAQRTLKPSVTALQINVSSRLKEKCSDRGEKKLPSLEKAAAILCLSV